MSLLQGCRVDVLSSGVGNPGRTVSRIYHLGMGTLDGHGRRRRCWFLFELADVHCGLVSDQEGSALLESRLQNVHGVGVAHDIEGDVIVHRGAVRVVADHQGGEQRLVHDQFRNEVQI